MSAIYLVDFTEKPMFAFLDGVPFHLVEIDGEAFAFTVVPTDSPFVFDLATTTLKLKTSGQPDPITTSGMARKTIDIPALEQSRDIVLCRVVTPRSALKTPVPQVLTGAMKQGDIFWTLVLEKTRTPIALMGSTTGEITLPPLAPHVPPMVIYTGIIMGNHSPEPLVGAPAYDESGKLVAISMGAESGDGALAIWFEKGDALISLARSKNEE